MNVAATRPVSSEVAMATMDPPDVPSTFHGAAAGPSEGSATRVTSTVGSPVGLPAATRPSPEGCTAALR